MPEHILSRRGVANGTRYALSTGQTVSADGHTRVAGSVGDTAVSMGAVIPPEIIRSLADSQGVREGSALVNHAGLPVELRGNTKVVLSVTLASLPGKVRRRVRQWLRTLGAAFSWQSATSLMGVETVTATVTVREYNERKTPAHGVIVSWRDDARSGAYRSGHHISGKRRGKRRATRGAAPRKPGLGSLRTPRS